MDENGVGSGYRRLHLGEYMSEGDEYKTAFNGWQPISMVWVANKYQGGTAIRRSINVKPKESAE